MKQKVQQGKQAGYQVINRRIRSVLQVARYTKIHIPYNNLISRKS